MATLATCGAIVFCLMGTTVCYARTRFFDDRACAVVTAIIAGYHVGVEQLGKAQQVAQGTKLRGVTPISLDSLLATPVVRCDEIAWSFANISMAVGTCYQ